MSDSGVGPDGYLCSCCGEWHAGLPMAYGADAPAQWFSMPAGERERRARLSSDQCIIGDTDFFIRGCVEIPVARSDEEFTWEVWVRVSEEDLDTACPSSAPKMRWAVARLKGDRSTFSGTRERGTGRWRSG